MGVAAGCHHGWWREEEELRLWAEKNQAVGDGRVNHQRGKGNNGWLEGAGCEKKGEELEGE